MYMNSVRSNVYADVADTTTHQAKEMDVKLMKMAEDSFLGQYGLIH